MMFAAEVDIWRYQPHPEVWLVIAGALALATYAVRVIGPKAVRPGEAIVTRRNNIAFGVGLALLWFAADWPMHDISEEYLYFVHMIQHLLLTFIIPPILLLAVPEWLGRLMVSESGTAGVWIRRLSRPVAAGFLFNLGAALVHFKVVVNTSVDVGVFHYLVHFVVFSTALLMWIPVVSPLPELRISKPGQMLYLFLMSILPTIPAAFLTFANQPLYESYDHPVRLWGISVIQDQQAAGVVMKLAGGIYLWAVITYLFFTWAKSGERTDRQMRRVNADGEVVLTFEQVQEAFETSPSAPADQH